MIYAIADLHLSFGLQQKKPMNIFDDNWKNHTDEIKNNWICRISAADVVLIPGDISWAMDLEEFLPDFYWIEKLPGKKIITGGNHDFWWKSTSKLNELSKDIFFLKNNFTKAEGFHICGAKGWVCPNDINYTIHDRKIFNREYVRLKSSLDQAIEDGARKIIVMLHYPPTNDKKETKYFVELIEKYPVTSVVYGHLHGNGCLNKFINYHNGINYHLVSGDYINFNPRLIMK